MKKALILASVASMIDQFNMQNIRLLLDEGYHVDVIANFENGNTVTDERIAELKKQLSDMSVGVYHVPIPRSIFNIKGILSSLKEVKQTCNKKNYNLVHCHSPIGSVIARLAAKRIRKNGCRVIYTAHGFHFFKGASLKNWVVFYPIEKICSRWTDTLITINKEDFAFSQKEMKSKCIEYIPGIGVDTSKFVLNDFDKTAKRNSLGLSEKSVVLFSVGELNQNKNQEVIIKALEKINNNDIHYVIAGRGDKAEYLTKLAKEKGVNLHLLGYRTDIPELFNMSDMFVFPSFREGLSVSLMEAMASGLPCVVSKIRGNVDLIDEKGGYLCNPADVDAFAAGIEELVKNKELRTKMGAHNQQVMKGFDVHKVSDMMRKIYFGE